MKNIIILLTVILGVVMTSCTTVTITTQPKTASVRLSEKKTIPAPAEISILPLFSKEIEIFHDGFDSKKITLTRKSPETMEIVLTRTFTITSDPIGASLIINKKESDLKTPCVLTLPCSDKNTELQLTLDGHVSRTVSLDSNFHIKKPITQHNVFLPQDGPGRCIPTVIPGDNERPIVHFTFLREQKDEKIPEDKATCIYTFPENQIPLSFSPLQNNSDELIITVATFKTAPSTKSPKELREKDFTISLIAYDTKKRSLRTLTDGKDFEISGVLLSPDTLLLSCLKTGRFDLWLRKLNEVNDDHLLNSINTAIADMAISHSGNKLIFSNFDLQAPTKLWVLSTERDNIIAYPECICEGSMVAWYPQDDRILFVNGNPPRIYSARPDGTNIKPLFPQEGTFSDYTPSWTPNGDKIVFASTRDAHFSEQQSIWVTSPNGSKPIRITNASYDATPVVAADNSTVFFLSNRELLWGIWTIQLPAEK